MTSKTRDESADQGQAMQAGREVISLHGLIRVQRMEPPPVSLFIVCPRRKGKDNMDNSTMEAEIEMFVRISALSPELAALVRRETGASVPSRELLESLHPDTRAEIAAVASRHSALEEATLRVFGLPTVV